MPLTDAQGADPDARVAEQRTWLVRFGLVAMIGVGAGIVAAGSLSGAAGLLTAGLLVTASVAWAVALSERWSRLTISVPAFVVVGLCGAALDLVQPRGPGFVAGYMALTGLALRAPRRLALIAGAPVLAAVAAAEARGSRTPTSAVLSVALGAGFLFLASSIAAANREARQHAVRLLEQQALTQRAREEAAALAERSRLARELHDVLAHSLAGLSVQLEATRLLAETSGSDPRVGEQLTRALSLARDGMRDARRAVQALRGDVLPGLAGLDALVTEYSTTTGVPARLEVQGEPVPLGAEAGLTVYRCVQEALTNVTKHAGCGATVLVRMIWTEGAVQVLVLDRGGDGVDSGLPSSGAGLAGLAERVERLGGWLTAAGVDGGFEVTVQLPTGRR